MNIVPMNNPETKSEQAAVSRRTFLKTSSTAIAGGALLGTLPVERFALGASPGDTIKLALVGCGGRGSGAAGQALSTLGGVKLVAVADAFKDRLESGIETLSQHYKDKVEVKQENKFIGFEAYKEAIAMADVVILATPPGFRPIHFEEAIRHK